MSAVIVIKAWDTFQHYKDRDPPWVKLYRDLLTAESWVLGTDDSRLVQVASMLLAARYRNATPLNFTLFARVASLDLPESRFRAAIDHLVSTGFLEIQGDAQPVKVSASKALATCTSEAETEKSREEAEKRESARKRATRRCPDDWKPSPEDVAKISRECPDVDMAAAERKFRDHEFAKARSDWSACWRNWMRTDQERAGKAGKPRPTRYEELMARARLPAPAEPSAVALFLAGGKL
jgi:hypothetical protein